MTISAKVFPIATVRRIIQVVAILVVNRQLLSLSRSKFPAASGTDQPVQGQGPVSVILLRGQIGPYFLHNFLDCFIAGLNGF